MKRFLLAFGLALTALAAPAEQAQRFDDYKVHYAAFRSDQLTPDMAGKVGITRSKERAIVLVNVHHVPAGKPAAPVAAQVTGRARTLLGDTVPLTFRELREAGAVDQLAEMPTKDGELLIFDLEIQPEGASTPYKLQFRQTFYTD